jgi:hypothetical protein
MRLIWIAVLLAKLLAAAVLALFPTLLLLRVFDPGGLPLDQEAFPTRFEGIAVASNGTIYAGVPGYSRVHLYTPDGTSIRAVRVPTGGAQMDLDFDAVGALQVTAIKNMRRYTFNADDTIRAQEKVDVWAPKHLERFIAVDGAVYAIGGHYMHPRIVKSTRVGRSTVVVEKRWPRDVRLGRAKLVGIIV